MNMYERKDQLLHEMEVYKMKIKLEEKLREERRRTPQDIRKTSQLIDEFIIKFKPNTNE